MRAFTREIGLQGGYGIEMDQELVLTEAIDNLLADLEKPGEQGFARLAAAFRRGQDRGWWRLELAEGYHVAQPGGL